MPPAVRGFPWMAVIERANGCRLVFLIHPLGIALLSPRMADPGIRTVITTWVSGFRGPCWDGQSTSIQSWFDQLHVVCVRG